MNVGRPHRCEEVGALVLCGHIQLMKVRRHFAGYGATNVLSLYTRTRPIAARASSTPAVEVRWVAALAWCKRERGEGAADSFCVKRASRGGRAFVAYGVGAPVAAVHGPVYRRARPDVGQRASEV